jgi:methyl-galactoside transport system ATP-binding protein
MGQEKVSLRKEGIGQTFSGVQESRDKQRQEILLHMEGMNKSFPGVKALDNARLTVRAGSVHALMGENGAGKSTLMKCLFGIYSKDSGRIFLEGKEVNFKSSREALDNGVAMVHQELNQALKRNVMDNIWLGRYPKMKGLPLVSEKQMYQDTVEVFEKLGLDINPRTIMSKMPVSQRQMVEIAKAVSFNSKIIVLDEPTSSLTEVEVEHLFKIINMLKSRGCGIIYISHKMDEILRISDEVTIMRDGQYIATKDAENLTKEEIIRLMVGREMTNQFPQKIDTVQDEEILRVEGLSAQYSLLNDVSFSLKKGEILGIAGLDGSGRTELLENIFGAATRRGGKIYKEGQLIDNACPKSAIGNGFALLTEERRATGIFSILDVKDNTVVASLNKFMSFIFLNDKAMEDKTDEMINAMSIKTPGQKTKIRALSGGNQQKVIFGRWLLTEPDVLLLDEPTRGIDVGAKYEIYQLIQNLAKEGKSVVMVSSEMSELLGVCNRILVMSGGRLAGEVDADNTSQEEIMTLAAKYV